MIGNKKTKVLNDGSNFPEVRKMTAGQVREFKEKKLDPSQNKTLVKASKDRENALGEESVDAIVVALEVSDAMVWWILDNVYRDYDFYDADYQACSTLAADTYTHTFGFGEVEQKNS